MQLTPSMVIITIIGAFLGAFMDSIAGGGGLITLPTYMLAGLPIHYAIGTNKFSAGIGTGVSFVRYLKKGYIEWKRGIFCTLLAIVGAFIGTNCQLMVDDKYLKYLLLIVLPIVAFIVLKQRSFPEEKGEIPFIKQTIIILVTSFVVGIYEGFYGPGTGTFLLLSFCNLAKMDVRSASGNAKLINFSSSITSMFVSLASGKVFIQLALIAVVFSITGNYIGSGLAIKNGSKIIKPMVVVVLLLLAGKVLYELFI